MSQLTDFRGLPLPGPSVARGKEKTFISFRKFGKGSLHEFDWYFEGRSEVHATSLEEILKWLRACEYVPDELLFREADFWQHPVTFESMRKGDCADHALWAWRKLAELGMETEFVVGKVKDARNGEMQADGHGHAWIVVRQPGEAEWRLIECTEKQQRRMVVPLAASMLRYFPKFSVDAKFQTYRHYS